MLRCVAFLVLVTVAAAQNAPLPQLVAALGTLSLNSLFISQPIAQPVSSCGMSAQIQSGDTCQSIVSTYGLQPSSLLQTLNPGLDCTNLVTGMSVCIGGVGSFCNTQLTSQGVCPYSQPGRSLVAGNLNGVQLSHPLRAILTANPDVVTLLQDPATSATTTRVYGVDALILTVPSVTPAVTAIEGNPGHPFVKIWADSGATMPLYVAVVPAWFANGNALISYVPGVALQNNLLSMYPQTSSNPLSWLVNLGSQATSQFAGRKLLRVRQLLGGSPPAGQVQTEYCSYCFYG